MKSYKGTIAESWKPTFENVTVLFITETLYEILFSEDLPNFRFEFREEEAISFIEKVLKSYTDKYDFYKEKSEKVLQSIKQKSGNNEIAPVMIINNYKCFFELLTKLYEKDIELYFLRTGMSGFPRYEKDNFFEQIWMRATPDDFNNPEEFLKKQVDMIYNNTFEKYDEETFLGQINFFDDNILCIKNDIARTWDENSKEFRIILYDKNNYNCKMMNYNYIFPVIRYGIYEKNGKRVCFIGSIQNIDSYEQNYLKKMVNRKKYKVNEEVLEEDMYKVEPNKLLALSIFINLLHKEGITEIEVPSLYVLDCDYHIKRNRQLLENFQKEWTDKKIEKYPEYYKKAQYYFAKSYEKENLISEIKTEHLFFTFRRLLQHYPSSEILSYPGEVDSFMQLSIPIVKDKNDINGSVFRELYDICEKLDNEKKLFKSLK